MVRGCIAINPFAAIIGEWRSIANCLAISRVDRLAILLSDIEWEPFGKTINLANLLSRCYKRGAFEALSNLETLSRCAFDSG